MPILSKREGIDDDDEDFFIVEENGDNDEVMVMERREDGEPIRKNPIVEGEPLENLLYHPPVVKWVPRCQESREARSNKKKV